MSNPICADILEWCKEYKGELFHALLCDPPYQLNFMGKNWDRTGISFDPNTWKALAEHLFDGAFIMAFASARGWHRQAVAMEDAGLIMHPTIFLWGYASGFPKATRIDTQVDKFGGLPLEIKKISEAIKLAREKRGLTISECDKKYCSGTTNWSWFEGRPKGINIPNSKTFKSIAKDWQELKQYQKQVEEAEREVVGKHETDMGGLGGQRLGEKGGILYYK